MRYVLNSAVLTAPGRYEYRLLSPAAARDWLRQGPVVSRVGYEATLAYLRGTFGLGLLVRAA